MKTLLLIIFTLTLNSGFAQTEQDSYKIYSQVINGITQSWINKPVNSIIIIKQLTDSLELYQLDELTQDSSSQYAIQHWFANDYSLWLRLKTDKDFKAAITNLTSNFINHPTIYPTLLDLDNVSIETLTSNEFHDFLFKGNHYKDKGWKKIERIYGTHFVFQLSKVEYQGNYATFYYSYRCGGLCGKGGVVLMENVNGKWHILKDFELWES